MLKVVRIVLAIIILLFTIFLLAWSYLPVQHQEEVSVLSPAEMIIQPEQQAGDPTLLEYRQVIIDRPQSMRIGDNNTLMLDFSPLQVASPKEGEIDGFSDVYDCCNLMVETRLDAAGIAVDPANPTRQSMLPGQPLKFNWNISANQEGTFSGTIWLSLRFLPLDGSNPIQGPIYVNEFQIKAESLAGMTSSMARIIGWMGLIVAVLLLGDVMISFIKRVLDNFRNPVVKDGQ
jgi:hypothetical protein